MYVGQVDLTLLECLAIAPVSDTLALNNADGSLVYAPGTASSLTVILSAVNVTKNVLISTDNLQLTAQAIITAAVTTEQMSIALSGSSPATVVADTGKLIPGRLDNEAVGVFLPFVQR